MTIARTTFALGLALVVAGCGSDGILSESAGTYANAQAENHLEARIGEHKGNVPATAAGTLLGPFLGSEVGESLRASDRRYAEGAALKSLEEASPGKASRWNNPETGHEGAFTPSIVYRSADNLLCRDYVQEVSAKRKMRAMPGTACRMADGSWRVAFGVPVRRALRSVRSTSSTSRNKRR